MLQDLQKEKIKEELERNRKQQSLVDLGMDEKLKEKVEMALKDCNERFKRFGDSKMAIKIKNRKLQQIQVAKEKEIRLRKSREHA